MKRRHHYVSQFYLRGFKPSIHEPYIWVYDKRENWVKQCSIKDIALEKDYFSYTTKDGEKDYDSLENFFSQLETLVAPVIRKLHRKELITDEERLIFSAFLAFSIARTPMHRKRIQKLVDGFLKQKTIELTKDIDNFKSIIEQLEKTGKIAPNTDLDKIKDFIDSKEYDVNPSREYQLIFLLDAFRLVTPFLKMKWTFPFAVGGFKYITSDNPVFVFCPSVKGQFMVDFGLAFKDVEVTFPLSKDLAFHAFWDCREGYCEASREVVAKLNMRTMVSTLRYVYSPFKSNSLLNTIRDFEGDPTQNQP